MCCGRGRRGKRKGGEAVDAWSFGRPFGSLFPPTHTPRLPDCVSIFDPRPRKEKKKTAGDAHERERERKRRKEAAIGQTREVACDPAPPLGWWALLCCLLPVLLPCCPFRLLPRFSVAWLAAPAAALERDWTDYSLLYKWVGGRVVMVSRPRPVLAFSSFSIASRPNYQKGLIFKKKTSGSSGKGGARGWAINMHEHQAPGPQPPQLPPAAIIIQSTHTTTTTSSPSNQLPPLGLVRACAPPWRRRPPRAWANHRAPGG